MKLYSNEVNLPQEHDGIQEKKRKRIPECDTPFKPQSGHPI